MFGEQVQRVARSRGWETRLLPGAALEMWKVVVEDCASGYDFDVCEYLDDLSIRSLLQDVLDDPEIRECSEYTWFSAEVQRIDAEFCDLIREGPAIRPGESRWWLRKVPPFGQREFVDDVRERYSVDLREIG